MKLEELIPQNPFEKHIRQDIFVAEPTDPSQMEEDDNGLAILQKKPTIEPFSLTE